MKLLAFLSAGLVAAAAVAPTAAPAQRHDRIVIREHDSRTVYRHGGPRRWHTRQVCTTRRIDGHRVRRCRTVRTR